MTMPAFIRTFARDRSGAGALEFALVVPVFIIMVLGVIGCAQMANAASSMNYAVQEAARCYALDQTRCGNPTAIAAYARTKYLGPGINPTFSSSTAGCGNTVTATATYRIDALFIRQDVPLRASACFPAPPAS